MFSGMLRRNYDEATISAVATTGARRRGSQGYYGRYRQKRASTVCPGRNAAAVDLKRLELTGREKVVESVVSNSAFGFAQIDASITGTLIFMKGKAPKQRMAWLNRNVRAASGCSLNGIRTNSLSPDGDRLAVSLTEVGNIDIFVLT